MPSVIAPVLIAKADRELVESLRLAGATSPATARPVAAPRHLVAQRLGRLLRAGVIREMSGSLYYLDEAAWTAFRGAQRRRMLTVVVLAISLVLLVVALGTGTL